METEGKMIGEMKAVHLHNRLKSIIVEALSKNSKGTRQQVDDFLTKVKEDITLYEKEIY